MSKQHIDTELKLARNAMNDFLTLTQNEVVEFLNSERIAGDTKEAIIFNKTIDILIHDFKAKYFL